jgi:DNA-binding beta-propeller fold protein YncE/4-amino-4-deoxy-L-arabinose transferase-like glycosyltransferase
VKGRLGKLVGLESSLVKDELLLSPVPEGSRGEDRRDVEFVEEQLSASTADLSEPSGKPLLSASFLKTALLVLAIVLAVAGQVAFTRHRLNSGLILYGLSLPLSIYALAATSYAEVLEQHAAHHGQRRKRACILLIALAAACEMIILWLDKRNTLSEASAFPLYFLCVALFAAAFLVLDGNPFKKLSRNPWEIVILVLILLLAFGLRAYRVDIMPPGFWTDEGNDGIEALQVLSGEFPTPFRVDWGGNPAMKSFYNALAVKLLGRNKIAIRGVAVAFGTLSVFFTYLLARQLFSARLALLASFLLAVSRWHIHRSRFDSVVIGGAFFQVLAFYFLFRGLRSRRLSDFAWAGLALGFGLNSYHGARIAPVIVVVLMVHQILLRRGDFVRRYYKAFATLVLGAVVLFAPLGLYYSQNINALVGRARYVWLFNNRGHFESVYPGDHSDLEMLGLQARDTFLMFNYRGDGNGVNNWGRRPMLDFVTSVLLVLGVGYSLFRWKDSRHFFLLSWLFLTLVTGSVLTIGAPQSARTTGVIAALCIEAAIFLDAAWEALHRALPKSSGYFVGALIAAMLAVSGHVNLDLYFNEYMQDRATWHMFAGSVAQLAEYIRSLDSGVRVHFLSTLGVNSGGRGLQFLSGGFDGQDFWDLSTLLPAREEPGAGVAYILPDSSVAPLLQYFYPNGSLKRFQDPFGAPTFVTYEVSANEVISRQGLTGRYYTDDAWKSDIVLVRRDGPIAFDWDRDLPLSGPFSVAWEGTLYVPQSGRSDFYLDASGDIELHIDGVPVIMVEGAEGLVSAAVDLARGLHAVALRYARSDEAGGWIRWGWAAPGASGGLVPARFMYTAPINHGLLGRYYANSEWVGQPSFQQVDPYLRFRWERNVDPLPSPFSVEWEGYLDVDQSGSYTFATLSSNGSWLYVDDQLVVDNGGQHSTRYQQGVIDLEAGQHRIKLRYVHTQAWRVMEVYWTPPDRQQEILPTDRLLPNAQGLVQVIASKPVTASTQGLPPLGDTLSYVTGWGALGKEGGQFDRPQDVAVSPSGDVYVVDTGNYRVQRFDATGRFLDAWGSRGEGPGRFLEPWVMDIDSRGNVYILDAGTGQVQKFTAEGQFLDTLGENSGFYSPRGLAIDRDGSLYVADTGGNRVVKLSPEGETLAQFGAGVPVAAGGLNQPDDVAIDGEENVLVSDKLNLRLQRFDPSGRPVGEWPLTWASSDRGPRITFGPQGQVLLLDPRGARIWAYDQAGRLLISWGGPGDGLGQLEYPTGIAVDREGYVYVVDAGAHRVHKFRLPES